MAEQKKVTKKPSAGADIKNQTQSEEVNKVVEETPKPVEAEPKSPLDEVMMQAEKAYAAYMDAERQVAKAYHENETQVAKAYKRAESQAQRSYDNLSLIKVIESPSQ